MTYRENLAAYLRGGAFELIPVCSESFMDAAAEAAYIAERGIAVGTGISRSLTIAAALGTSSILIEPKVFPWSEQVLSGNETIRAYATGARWRYVSSPIFFREMVAAPLPGRGGDVRALFDHDEDGSDVEAVADAIAAVHAGGRYAEIVLYGAWLGIYLLFMRFEDALASLAGDRGLVRELVGGIRAANLRAIDRFAALGADGFVWADDAGSGLDLLFSPRDYEELFLPAHASWAARCHDRGTIARLHSHGNIAKIMDAVVDAGIDIVHPLGPGDGNDLAAFKRRWGRRICLNGGISRFIARMSWDETKAHVDEVVRTGLPGGKFMPCTESGIPAMPAARVDAFVGYLADSLERHRTLAAIG